MEQIYTLKGKERTTQVIFYHILLQRTFYEIRRHNPCVEFNCLEEGLKRHFVIRRSRILTCFCDNDKEHESLKYLYGIDK
jgi:hypothetical protein